LQPWNVYAVTGEPLNEIKRQAVDEIDAHCIKRCSRAKRKTSARTEFSAF
jgi:hypothetical protein